MCLSSGAYLRALATVWAGWPLCLVPAWGATQAHTQPPAAQFQGLQFDACIELRPLTAPRHTVLFARYWVSGNSYAVAVVWSEPHGSRQFFSTYPPTLRVFSDKAVFKIEHDTHAFNRAVFAKPLTLRTEFAQMFGDYPVQNLRFAEAYASWNRVFHARLPRDFLTANISPAGLTASNAQGNVELHITHETNDFLALCALTGSLRERRVTNYYDVSTGTPHLTKRRAWTEARPVDLKLPGAGVNVRSAAKQNQRVQHITGWIGAGDRQFEADFDHGDSPLGIGLPRTALIRREAGGNRLVSISFHNYTLITTNLGNVEEIASRFAGFDSHLTDYRELLLKYWKQTPIHPTDLDRLFALLAHFERSCSPASLGERLRRLNVLMELSRLSCESQKLGAFYRQYLAELSDGGLSQAMLNGGYSVIEVSLAWGRFDEADKLLSVWLGSCLDRVPLNSCIDFARNEVLSGTYWGPFRLLETLADACAERPDVSFRRAAICALAVNGLRARRLNRNEQDARSCAELNWTQSKLKPEDLDRLVGINTEAAWRALASLSNRIPEDADLVQRLQAISPK